MEIDTVIVWHMLGFLSEDNWADAYKRFGDNDDFKELLKEFDRYYKTDIYGQLYEPEVE